MAERLDISPAYWSRVERGIEKPPRDKLIERAAAILGIPFDELFVEARRLPPDRASRPFRGRPPGGAARQRDQAGRCRRYWPTQS